MGDLQTSASAEPEGQLRVDSGVGCPLCVVLLSAKSSRPVAQRVSRLARQTKRAGRIEELPWRRGTRK